MHVWVFMSVCSDSFPVGGEDAWGNARVEDIGSSYIIGEFACITDRF